MFRTLQARLLFFFLLISLGGIILVSLAIQLGFFDSFRDYLDTKRLEQVENVINQVELEYQNIGEITGETISATLHHHAMADQLFFQIYQQDGTMITDSLSFFKMMPHNQMNMPNIDKLKSESFSLTIDNQVIGKLIVYFPTDYVSIDSQFLNQFNKYIIFTALTMIVISIVISILISKKVSQGLRKVSLATEELQRHNFEVRIPLGKQVEEIEQLAKAFNQLAQSLSDQEKLRTQFTNDLAHEFRTPLATLRSQIEAFLDGVWQPTPDRLKQQHSELMRLVRLVDELEQLLAAENPQIQLFVTEIKTNALLNSLHSSFKPLFQQKGVELSIEELVPELTLRADRDRIFQIMTNLLNNALKYTDEGGRVTLQVNQDNQFVKFIISDNGQGISKEDLPYIYERFYRGEKSRNRKTGGVGIGLSIVKALVLAHHGNITIDSERNKGTKVIVCFIRNDENF